MGSKKRKKAKEQARIAAAPIKAPPARSPRGRMFLVALVVAIVAGIASGVTVFLLRRNDPIKIDAGSFTLDPSSTRHSTTRPWADDATVYAAYAGSGACKECHWDAHAFWSRSHHGRAERKVDPKRDAEAFVQAAAFKHGTQQSHPRVENGKYQVVTNGFGGQSRAYDVLRAIGVSPLVQYLVDAPGSGRTQALEVAWDPHKKQWFNVYGDEDRKPGEWGHWTGRGMNWESQCAACHNTRVRKNYNEATDRYDLKMAEMTVSCESCHGPMKTHADWRRQYGNVVDDDPTVRPVDKERMFETCGSCHARRRDLTGEFVPGDSFHDHHQLTLPDRTDVFYPDGQVRDEDYEWGAFLGSRMHAAGVRCTDCHHPHSAEPILPGNLLCMRCHSGPGTGSPFENAPVIDEKAHTFHKPDSAGSTCVNCHMPQTTFMQRHGRHDHGFTVPDPLITKDLGIPNACNRCHTDKDPDWSLAAVDKWYGKRMELPNRTAARIRTRAVAAARRGEEAARDPLLAIAVDDKQNPYWRAAAYGLLDQRVGESNVAAVLLTALKDPSPLVRGAAVHSLQPLVAGRRPDVLAAVTPLLKDPSRSVRLAVAWAMRREVDLNSPAGRELLASVEHHLDQPAGRMQLGVLMSARGRWDMALREFNKAIEWDPNSPPFRYEAAVVLSQVGRSREAVAQLEEAIRQAPANAEFHFALGLAHHEAGALDKATASLERAVQFDGGHARAWYNLGLARVAKNQLGEAVEALSRGERADPSDPAIPYARATVLARLGKVEEAAAAARQALRLRPNYADARELLRRLGQPP